MLYYKVKPEYDQTRIYTHKGRYVDFLIGEELYTEKELNKLLKDCNFLNAKTRAFEPVEISKNNIYWFFGARFQK